MRGPAMSIEEALITRETEQGSTRVPADLPDYRTSPALWGDQKPNRKLPCRVCGLSPDLEDKLTLAQNQRDQFQRNWSEAVFLMLGEFPDAIDPKTRRLRADAADLLKEARDHEHANQLEIDSRVAVGWASTHLTEAEQRLTDALADKVAHLERQHRIDAITSELEELDARSDAAVARRDEAHTIDQRIDAASQLAGIEHVSNTLRAELDGLNILVDPVAIQARVDDLEAAVAVWRERVDDPDLALTAYVADLRSKFNPQMLQQLVDQRSLPVSRLAVNR